MYSINLFLFLAGDSVILNVISEPSDDLLVGQTLKGPLVTNYSPEQQKYGRNEDLIYNFKPGLENDRFQDSPKYIVDQGIFSFHSFEDVNVT